MLLLEDRRFYTYIYLDPRKEGNFIYGDYKFQYEPFYVGKGRGRRDKRHLSKSNYSNSNTHKYKLIKYLIDNGYTIQYFRVKENLLETEAFDLEINLIRLIGRQDVKSGPLCNHTDGGDGSSGGNRITKGKTLEEVFGKDKANEIKEKFSKARKEYIKNNGCYEHVARKKKVKDLTNPLIKERKTNSSKGKKLVEIHGEERANLIKEKIIKNLVIKKIGDTLSDETKEKIRKSLLGNTRRKGFKTTDETKKHISEAKKGTLSWNATPVIQLTKNGDFIKEWVSATAAAKELNLSQGNIWMVINGDRNTCGDYKWKLK